ncbi:MAG: hypothetical protein WCL32_08390 [Planctomycetota bacterium]
MERLRLGKATNMTHRLACSRCGDHSRNWDRVAGKSYCPQCLELLAAGEAEPIIERTDSCRCAICYHLGTVRYLTYPLRAARPIEVDLCSEHLRSLVARRLGPHAFEHLRRQLALVDLRPNDVFLLHDAFYDNFGRAQQPVEEGYF